MIRDANGVWLIGGAAGLLLRGAAVHGSALVTRRRELLDQVGERQPEE